MARAFAGRRTGTRRLTAWSASAPVAAYTALAASSVILLEVFIPTVPRQTIVRIRGIFSWRTDQESAAEFNIGAYGIAVVEEPAATAGIASLPHPGTDGASEAWMYYHYFATDFAFITGAGFGSQGKSHTIDVDTKAMRKFEDNNRIVVVVQNQSAFGVEVLSQIRILSKLS